MFFRLLEELAFGGGAKLSRSEAMSGVIGLPGMIVDVSVRFRRGEAEGFVLGGFFLGGLNCFLAAAVGCATITMMSTSSWSEEVGGQVSGDGVKFGDKLQRKSSVSLP